MSQENDHYGIDSFSHILTHDSICLNLTEFTVKRFHKQGSSTLIPVPRFIHLYVSQLV